MSVTKPKTRESLTTRQRSILISFYNQNPYPSSSERYQLVQLTGRTLKQIQDWFSNRRRTDSKLGAEQSTSASQPPSTPLPINMETSSYYYNPAPQPPMFSVCSCCGLPQSVSSMNQSFYPAFHTPTIYYPQSNNFHS